MSFPRFLLTALRLGIVSSSLWAPVAFGQWVWKDEAGQIVASDQPPPAGTPQSRIVKSPRTKGAPPPPVVEPDPAKADAPKSLADRDLDSKQRQKEAADEARKADEEAARARVQQQNCAASRSNLAALQSGGRSAQVNDKGERSFITDEQRQGQIGRTQGQIAQFCH